MLLRSIALLTASTAAVSAGKSVEIPMDNISANSKLGGKIMSKARRLDANNQQVGAWVANYSLVFQQCAVSDEYFAFEGGNNDKNNWQGQQQQKLVHFKLCPSSNCKSCSNGADYVVPMVDFVEMYFQAKMNAQEYNCEVTKNNCYCENANDDQACESQCYANAGLDYCEDNNQNNNNNNNQAYEFDIDKAGRCEKMNVDKDTLYYYFQENAGSNGYNVYGNNQGEMGLYIGPQCSSNGKAIYLNVFMDEWCSIEAPKDAFSKFTYGQTLPYSSTSIIENNCISCKEPQDANQQNNGDQQDEDQILEVCERLYEESAKCEEKLPSGTTYYPNSYGCTLVKSLKAPGKASSRSSSGHASKVFAGLFAATTIAFAGVAYYFYQKAERTNVALVNESGEGAMA